MKNILNTQPLSALYLHQDDEGVHAGFATIGAFGRSGWVHTLHANHFNPYALIDELLHLVFVSSASRILIGYSSYKVYEPIKHHFDRFDVLLCEAIPTALEQEKLFKTVFGLETLLHPLEHLDLESEPLGAMALSLIALESQQSHYLPFSIPLHLPHKGLVELGNTPLEQLEMISFDERGISIAALLLSMRTDVGRALGKFRFALPITNSAELERRYTWVEGVMPHSDALDKELQRLETLQKDWARVRRGDSEAYMSLYEGMQNVANLSKYLRKHCTDITSIDPQRIEEWGIELRNSHHSLLWRRSQIVFMDEVLSWIAVLDVAVSSARMAKRYALCRPNLIDTQEYFIQAMGLRHLLVEAQGCVYEPNDIVMGNRDFLDLPYPDTVMLDPRVHDGADIHGVLLYGINSSGKSSLMKSIGIAVMLAQGGFFVPARAMIFSPFDAIFTRILSRDNVVKSLSTFGVEMLELNTIFHHTSAKTLVLGDEISHGTETLSAVAIVASTILQLASNKALFILTTHLHQLGQVRELARLRQVVSLHLSVHYDETNDRLVFDRKLRGGSGSSMYGLEFAKSLHIHEGFMKNAMSIREALSATAIVLPKGKSKWGGI